MVKNTQGGSKHKGLARKLVNAPTAKPRLSECDDECYAVVTKMLGNGMCHVDLSYQSNIIRNVVCHIRGKFRGRNKKNNIVQTNNFVLVGLRTWDSTIKNCDLMFTFIDSHIHSIPFDFNSLLYEKPSSNLHDLFQINSHYDSNYIDQNKKHDLEHDLEHDNDNDNDFDVDLI